MAKLDLNRVDMPKQDPEVRARNFDEVALGYDAEMALNEANRCIQCPRRPCVEGCPVSIDIPGFINAISESNMPDAVRILKDKNSLPGVCGRVCPQETQCEEVCTLAKRDAPIAIGRLERYVADWERQQGAIAADIPPSSGRKVAVVGSGPAGLTCAADLAKAGYTVTIFEALHEAGGVLIYGIPEFRMPNGIVQGEVDYVKSLGVEVRLDSVIGKILSVDELLADGYDAIFLASGAGLPMFMDIPGENFSGIYSANEFLTRINLMKAYLKEGAATPMPMKKRIAVIGGGNVAMDSARCAQRLGADQVYIIYRRSEAEMPARAEEVENAHEEGIIFKFLTNPVRFLGNGRGWVSAMECIEMELGEPDASGRRRPIPKEGSEFVMDIDTVVVALGTTPNPLVPSTTEGLETTRWGTVVVDEKTGQTTRPQVWAGGDLTTGAATVISAMDAGKTAAASIHEYLQGKAS
jgi:glutamate synthase (NADPH/NADH) small chain